MDKEAMVMGTEVKISSWCNSLCLYVYQTAVEFG